MPFWKKKPNKVQAAQWHNNGMLLYDLMKQVDILSGINVKSVGKQGDRLVIKLLFDKLIYAEQGDWIVKDSDGFVQVFSDRVFRRTFEPYAAPADIQ